MSAFIPSSLPLRPSLPSSTRQQTPRCALDKEAPPASRYAKNYPPPCFEAPHISLLSSGVELVNKVGVVREEVPLDLEQAAQLLAQARAAQAKAAGDLSILFSGPVIDNYVSDPSDKYYPSFRRDETPIIEITPPTGESDGQVSISLGSVVATPPPEGQTPALPGVEAGSTWNLEPSSAFQVVDRCYSPATRNLAPVIEIPDGELSISLEMKEILGECEAELYPKETRFMAPKIEIRKPLGDWDTTAFVNLAMEEVQLPLIEAAILKIPEHPDRIAVTRAIV